MKARSNLTKRLIAGLLTISVLSVMLAEVISGFVLVYRENKEEAHNLSSSMNLLVSQALTSLSSSEESLRLPTRLKSALSFSEGPKIFEVADEFGGLIYSNQPDIRLHEIAKDASLHGGSEVKTVILNEHKYFILRRDYKLTSGESRAFFVASAAPHWSTFLKTLFLEDVLILVVTFALSLVFARAFATKLIQPVKLIASRLRMCISKDPLQWPLLPESEVSEFLGEIVAAVNNLISRVQQSSLAQDHLARYVAHEVKTPLTIMLGEIQTFSDAIPPTDEMKKLLAQFEKDILHTNGIVNSILDLASRGRHKSAHKPECVEVDTLLEKTLTEFSRSFQMDCKFVNQAPRQVAFLDPNLLRILTDNLFRNAFKHGGSGVSLEVTLSHSKQAGLVIEICDTGPGFPTHILESNDSPLPSSSFGIGLSLCREICNITGWSIKIENREYGGGRVSVSFPVAEPWMYAAAQHKNSEVFAAN